MTQAVLVTADGQEFVGESVGADGIATGEAVFNTSMTGYQEILTDPSYAGQVVVMTTSHIGNYGVAAADNQADLPHASAFVMRSMARLHSNWRAEGGFGDYLTRHGVVGIGNIDTRRLTRHLRDRGAMPVAVGVDCDVAELVDRAAQAPRMEGRDLASGVSTVEPYVVSPPGDPIGRVVAFDLGIKRDILSQLVQRGLEVHVVPAGTTAREILALRPGGVFVSNGPGDPEPLTAPVAAVRELLGNVPIFGICLGLQVLGLALGATTYKLGFGHHGGNHPVRNLESGNVAITAQNHGFAVDLWSLTDTEPPARSGIPTPEMLPARVSSEFGVVASTHQNLNDGTIEGFACLDVAAFGVQYHPEAAPGPHDAVGLFDQFVTTMGLS